ALGPGRAVERVEQVDHGAALVPTDRRPRLHGAEPVAAPGTRLPGHPPRLDGAAPVARLEARLPDQRTRLLRDERSARGVRLPEVERQRAALLLHPDPGLVEAAQRGTEIARTVHES